MAAKPVPTPAPAAGGSNKKMVIIGAVVAAVVAGGGVGGFMMMRGGGKAPAEGKEASAGHGEEAGEGPVAGKAIYFALEPAFTVGLADEGTTRYLQVEVQVMARNQDVIDAVTLHMPVIRDRLLSLLSQNKVDELRSLKARDELREKSLEEVRKILKDETGKAGVEALYFTSFVTQ